jgi:hypothetical protein
MKGAVVGAVALTIVGFSSLGWTLGSTAAAEYEEEDESQNMTA